jgi:hypothetical protein
MISTFSTNDRYANTWDEAEEQSGFERFRYRSHGEYPVRSHASRSRAKMRSLGGAAARRKARTFNGVNRRGRSKYSNHEGRAMQMC